MSVRLSAVALAGILVGCDSSQPKGPPHVDAEALRYVSAMTSGQALYIRNGRGSITVEPSADDSVRVTGALSWRGSSTPPADISFSATGIAEGVLVCAHFGDGACTVADYHLKSKGLKPWGNRDVRVEFTVQVPTGVQLDMIGVDTRIVSASTAPVKARTINGSITVATAVGPVRAQTVNGSVDARMTTLGGSDSVVVRSLNGDAWVFLPEAAAATVDVATGTGRLATDFPQFQQGGAGRKSLSGALNGGGTPVKVRTLNGQVGLGRLDAAGQSTLRP